MGLPKIDIATFSTTQPSSKNKKLTFRPFLVKEEKILMMAMQGENLEEQITAIKQIINNCSQQEFDVDTIPLFDLEWIFLQLRIHSVGDQLNLKFKHRDGKNTNDVECDHVSDIKLDLKEVEMVYDKSHNKEIEINDKITIFLKYPNIETAGKIKNTEDAEGIIDFLSSGIEFIKDDEKMYETKDFTQEEIIEFFEQFNQQQMLKIQNFYRTQPIIQHEINYTCEKCSGEENVILRGLQDFLE
jgi:hypothetical protein|tara:strand:+ start:135 stop:863 length:729 start_codon:yes stop_codon:yes gene_type:complete